MFSRFRGVVSMALLLILSSSTLAQTTYTWGHTGPTWSDAGSWLPGGGPPTSADTALFDHYPGTTFSTQPTFTASASVGRMLFLGPRTLANFTLTGGGNTLTLGTGAAMSESALTLRGGFGTTLILNNLQTNVATGTSFTGTAATIGAMEFNGFGARLSLTNGSILRLTNAANTQNYDLTVSGAQISLAAGTQITNGIGNAFQQGRLTFQGGGILNVNGTTGTTNFTLNQVAAQSGNTQINLTRGAATALNLTLGNSSQAGIDGFVRDFNGTALSALSDGTIQINTGDVMALTSGATGPTHVFLGTGGGTIAQTNGVITRGTSSNTNSPYVVITGNISGFTGLSGALTRFAAFNTGTGEVQGQAGTLQSETTLGTAAVNENTIYRPTSGANATLNNSISVQTLVLEPRSNNQSIDLNGNTITTNGIAVSGGTSTSIFTLTGGSLAGTAAADRHFFVSNSGVTLAVSSNFAGSNNSSIIKAGNGILSLTGTTDQMSFPAITNIVINSGILRARIDGAGQNFGTTNNSLFIRGGVLEIDAQGGTSTFTRSLGTSAGQVNWTGGIASEIRQERGSGGFAAINGTVNVNIGGAGATLVWNGSDATNRFFLRSGNALTLGSTTQTGILNFQNGIGLDDGSASAPRDTRYINIANSPATVSDQTRRVRLTGVISGGPNTSLAYGGSGLVEVTGANTYSGGTIIDQAYVQINNTTGSGTGTGPVMVTRGILLGNGTIAPSAGNGVTVTGPLNIGGYLIADSTFGVPGHLKIGTDGINNPVTFNPGGVFGSRIHGSTFDTNGGTSSYGRLTIRGTGAITITDAVLSTGLSNTFTPSAGDAFGLIDNQTANAIVGTFNGIAQDGIINILREDNSTYGTARVSYTGNIVGTSVSATGGNDVVIYGFVPVPEPGLMLGVIALGGYTISRIRRRKS
jgi:fibronectin-binding autotransporter adhesin